MRLFTRRSALFIPLAPAIIGVANAGQQLLLGAGTTAGGAPPAGPTAIAFQASATAHTTGSAAGTIVCPTVAANDIIVIQDFCEAGVTPSLVVPTGFTSIASGNNGASRGMITTYKIADGTESGTTITSSTTNNTKTEKILSTYRASGGTFHGVTLASVNSQFPSGSPPSNQTITASGGTPPLVAIACYGCTTTLTRGFSPAATAELTESFNYFLFTDYKIYNSSPADITVSTPTNSVAMHSFYLAVT